MGHLEARRLFAAEVSPRMVRRSRPYDVLIRPRKQDGGCNGCLGLLRLIEASGSRLAACSYRGSHRKLALASVQIRVKEGPLASYGSIELRRHQLYHIVGRA